MFFSEKIYALVFVVSCVFCLLFLPDLLTFCQTSWGQLHKSKGCSRYFINAEFSLLLVFTILMKRLHSLPYIAVRGPKTGLLWSTTSLSFNVNPKVGETSPLYVAAARGVCRNRWCLWRPSSTKHMKTLWKKTGQGNKSITYYSFRLVLPSG